MERRADNARLRARLKLFDPAEGDEGLTPAERARMRRSIVEAASAARPSRALRLVPALAACVLVLLLLWLVLPSRRGAATNELPPVHAQGRTSVPANPIAERNDHRAAEQRPEPRAGRAPEPRPDDAPTIARRRAPSVKPVQPATARTTGSRAAVVATAQDRAPRTIHYVTSSGTQIIWTLDPQLDI